MLNKILFAAIIAVSSATANAQDSLRVDSTATELREVVVEGRRAWVDGNRMIFVPDSYEKKFSNSPYSLINEMHLPDITATDNKISGRTGELEIYINGQKETQTDIAVFWPKDVIRVEYIENPRDGGYAGASAVINFVVKRYSAGGVAKVNGEQTIRNNGNYGAAAKVVYKKVTYGLSVYGGYDRNPDIDNAGSQTFRDVYYGGEFYPEITRTFSEHYAKRSQRAGAVFDFTYKTDRFHTIHKAAVSNAVNPGYEIFSSESWLPDIFNADYSHIHLSDRRTIASLSGFYNWDVTPKWLLRFSWDYSHWSDRSNSGSTTGNLPTVFVWQGENGQYRYGVDSIYQKGKMDNDSHS